MPAPVPPWMSASGAPTTWMLRMARNAPIVAPTTAIQVLNDTSSPLPVPGKARSRWRMPGGDSAAEAVTMTGRTPLVSRGRRNHRQRCERGGCARPRRRRACRRLRVDGGFDGHARTQAADQRLPRIQNDLHRDALHDFGEIPRGVVRRQEAELKSARGGEAVRSVE